MNWWREGELMRPIRLVLLATCAALILSGLLLVPDLIRFLPSWVLMHPVEWTATALLWGYFLARMLVRRRSSGSRWGDRWARALDCIEAVSGTLLKRWLAVGFAGISTIFLLLWLPHYVYWPWCRDTDSYAQMAQEWSSGVLPYRDIRSFNFPGHIYLHWILGKLFGWGHTGRFYALDAAALLFLGASVIAWSRRRLGFSLPGTAAFLIFLGYYLDISFENVAERDWHAPLCATLGLLLLDAWPGRLTRWLSALLAAMAFTIRPNAVLFFPALLVATMRNDVSTRDALARDRTPITPRRTILAALEWICVFGVLTTVAFTPLIVSGLLGDFVRGLRILRQGGPYSNSTLARSGRILLEELSQPKIWTLVIGLVLLAVRAPDRNLKVSARTWLVAFAGALVYRPIHPLDHGYLKTPLALVVAVAWAIPIAWLIRATTGERRIGSTLLPGVLVIMLIVYESIPILVPRNCDLRVSVDSVRAAASGGWPEMPPGAWIWYSPQRGIYRWDAYCRVLNYIREKTGPQTIVANVLKHPPFPSVNGAAGRRSPFRVESGVAWMWVVAEDLDEPFARELEELGGDSIVVWSPEEIDSQPRLPLKRLTEVILNEYTPEARFDLIEVWRRKRKTPETSPASPEAR
jgi:hypothetical protein